ncbi:GNAT family N-acetyltransferase [Roseovarius faecimaris]|uniref:L-ornithine N(alpha)-acyltransferase n=1 Tax=Roseovarius faecimaris TaxID=2494550 RepID=A0A6I6IR30_9RHOB|nr:GNAT family N-acyltransferase [Roseovarius faecimaris]QGX98534.1 GNAT family N-acetyltransferase [Roseovarius faecimaris]
MADRILGSTDSAPQFRVKLAENQEELEAAQRLRYRVFVQELGADGPLVDHERGLETDRFDAHFDHLILQSEDRPGEVVGVYRLLRDDQAAKIGQFYSEDEYDLEVLKSSGRRIMELGRSCLDPAFRGGTAMYHLWNSLARYVSKHKIEILFGVASFHGTDPAPLAPALSLLHHRHLAPESLRPRARAEHYQDMNLLDEAALDRRAAMVQVPALIKAYLRLGGYVGEGAYIDHRFNTTDICLVMDTARMRQAQKNIYTKGVAT